MLKSGVLQFEMGGESIVLQAGEVLVIPPESAASGGGARGIDGDGFVHAGAGGLDHAGTMRI